MCRMIGVVSRGPVYYDLFEEFADLATQGMCPIGAPDERGHKDGWGLACFQNGALKMHVRDAGCAAKATRSVRDEAIEKYGGFTGLNFMLSDGQSLHLYRDFQTNGQYYTLYLDNLGEMVVSASEPILAMQAEPIPRGTLHSISQDLVVKRAAIS